MDFEEFLCKVVDGLQEKLGNGYRLETHEINKVNDPCCHSIEVIAESDANIHPCIYVDDLFKQYILGKCDIRRAVDEIYVAYKGSTHIQDRDVSFFSHWEMVKPRILARLVNTKMNDVLLQDVPHREYLDLSFIYYVPVAEEGTERNGIIQIRNEHMQLWGVDGDTLYNAAWENMHREGNVLFKGIDEILQPLERIPSLGISGIPEIPMYVLSNKEIRNGAVQMGNMELLQRVGSFFKDDFWILPSSIHEVLVIPFEKMKDDAEKLAYIVRDVNGCIDKKEVLSDHVYRYHRLSGEVAIAG